MNSTRTDGVRLGVLWIRRSSRREATVASHSSTASASIALITVSAEIRSPPKLRASWSSRTMAGCNSSRMLSAAIVQTVSATALDQTGSRTRLAVRRITTQAVSRLTVVRTKACGQPMPAATNSDSHCRVSQHTGKVSGASARAPASRRPSSWRRRACRSIQARRRGAMKRAPSKADATMISWISMLGTSSCSDRRSCHARSTPSR